VIEHGRRQRWRRRWRQGHCTADTWRSVTPAQAIAQPDAGHQQFIVPAATWVPSRAPLRASDQARRSEVMHRGTRCLADERRCSAEFESLIIASTVHW